MGIEEHWPLAGIEVVTDGVTLRYPVEDELAKLAGLARDDIHPQGARPFPITGWIPEPRTDRAQSLLRYHWRSRGEWSPEKWNLVMVAVVEGAVAGTQAIGGMAFGVTGTVTTGSWLHPSYQGRGIGTAMRDAVLAFAFEGLGAEAANTSAYTTNIASLAVSKKLGYQENGITLREVGGVRTVEQHLQLRRDDWTSRAPAEVRGLSDAALAMFGCHH